MSDTPKLLSVDDSAIIRKIVKNTADLLGFGLLEAGNGQEALDILKNHASEVNLILLDWNMPVMDGPTTLKFLKESADTANIPVMMLTTEGAKSNIIEAIKGGAKQYFLTKPFTPEDLSTRILQCVDVDDFLTHDSPAYRPALSHSLNFNLC
ncbi:MAG: response regulator [Vampirovibrionales bacterium]